MTAGPYGPLVIGVDAGGTTTRCVVATGDGAVLGTGTAAGANQHSSGGDASARLAEALREALAGLDTGRVAAGVFGIAGAGGAGHAAAREAAEAAWRSVGLPGRPRVVTDAAVAFAAGTHERAGVVLVAGTGAIAAAVRDGEVVRRCDGYGWLLGDDGSAVWLGREAVRAALAANDGRGEPTALSREVPRALLGESAPPGRRASGHKPPTGGDALAQALVAAVYGRPPADLGRLGPVLVRVAAEGDAVARRIADEAAAHLLAAVDAVRPAAPEGSPVVVTGSVLSRGPVAEAVRAGLAARIGAEPLPAGDGSRGAAALALRALGAAGASGSPAEARAAAAHRALLAADPGTARLR